MGRERIAVGSERNSLQLPHGTLDLPAFLPDATHGFVRSVDTMDLERCGINALMMNTFHLMQRPGSSTIDALGGLHRMCAWSHPIVTDSGGFQAYSLIRQNVRAGTISARGITFRPDGASRKFTLTPEKTVQLQLGYGADIVICLDDCTHVDAPADVQRASVDRTIDWARRGKREFERIVQQRRLPTDRRPRLFAVVQGGGSIELRRRCASELLEIGFDGFGFGGWPLDREGHLLLDVLAFTRELVPAHLPMHALGVGHPANVAAGVALGYDLFDSALPTRDARRGRLYVFTGEPVDFHENGTAPWLDYLYVGDAKHIKADRPISPDCDCACCATYSVGYLHHLYSLEDALFPRLATMHNLRFMTHLMERLGGK